jgi:subtilisin-like proprotein convertase family protein
MPRSLRLAALPAALAVVVVAAAVAQAAAPTPSPAAARPPGERPGFDIRETKASVPSAQLRTRATLDRRLGAAGGVSTDPASGRVRMVATTGGHLASSGTSPADTVRDFLRTHAKAYGVDGSDLALLRRSQHVISPDGVSHVFFDQVAAGIPVFGPGVRGDLDRAGRLVDVSGSPVPGVTAPGAPALTATEARARASASVGGRAHAKVLSRSGEAQRITEFPRLESARLVLFPTASGTRLAWRVGVNGVDPYFYEVVVDARTGQLLYRRGLTDFDNDDSAQVFETWPGGPGTAGTQQPVNLSADPTWLNDSAGHTRLFGNNAHTYADVDGSDSDDSATEDVPRDGTGGGTTHTYRFPLKKVLSNTTAQPCPPDTAGGCTWDPGDPTSQETNRKEATTQAFYFVNRFHDHLKAAPIGFNEASGNFQESNPAGTGGVGGDPVNTEANDNALQLDPEQDSRNNANMSTDPIDGRPPRMQMYLFSNEDTSGFSAVNGDDEADIVYHEYTHGLSNRLVPDLGGTLGDDQGGAMGEAWSDFYAMDYLVSKGYLTDTNTPGELRVGEYVGQGQDLIRTQPVDCPVGAAGANCPAGGYTYADYGDVSAGPEVHADGEIWAATLWDLRQALGSNVALTLVTGGMRLSPADPSYLDMRDAIIREDGAAFASAHFKQLSAIFAARGMGGNAVSNTARDTDPKPGFSPLLAFAPRALAVDDTVGGNGDHIAQPGESFRLTAAAQNLFGIPVSNATATLVDPSSGLSVGGSGTFPGTWTANAVKSTGNTLTGSLSASAVCGQSHTATLRVSTSAGAFDAPVALATAARDGTASVGTSSAVAIPDADPAGASSSVTIRGPGAVKGARITIGSLTHKFDSDLVITLQHAGRTATLADGVGRSRDNFTNTVFRDDAATPIESGTGPFTGSFRPHSPLAVFDGTPRAGAWTLHVVDRFKQDTGTLRSWSADTGQADCATATTGDATRIRSTRARLNGTVNPRGAATSARFEFGRTTSYGHTTTTTSAGSGSADAAVTGNATGLRPNTTYHYRALAVRGSAVVARGADRTFKTDKRVLIPNRGTERLSRKGAFTYAFKATSRARGKVSFTTRKKFKKGKRKRHLVIATKSWHAKKSGRATVRVKLKRRYVRLVRRQHKLTLTVKATIRGGSADRGKLTLKPHKKKGRRRH